MTITTISARVMESYDYSHFEVAMTATLDDPHDDPVEAANRLRVFCARLADKAILDYKRHKRALAFTDTTWFTRKDESGERHHFTRAELRLIVDASKDKPEGERTPKDKAAIKLEADLIHAAKFDYGSPDHEDDDEGRYDDDNP